MYIRFFPSFLPSLFLFDTQKDISSFYIVDARRKNRETFNWINPLLSIRDRIGHFFSFSFYRRTTQQSLQSGGEEED